ncbi:MAG: SMP-30/gluconolactonase/LRE family protein [Caulobacteraceae bacterium]|nr:SMP-30/gluconolactonase/LRE family protein [Caulobacter sp.]
MPIAPTWDLVRRPAHLPQRDQLGEGPWWDDAAQALWWVDIVGGGVQRLDPATGEVRRWATGAHASAAAPAESGGLVLALPDGLKRLNLGSGLMEPFARPDPDAGNRSNECRTDPQGRIWLGTMSNNLAADGTPVPLRGATGGLFRVEADGRSTQVLSGIGIANTLCWSPDAKRLYFADSLQGVIWSFGYDPDRPVLEDRRVFADPQAAAGAPDGSAMDEDGCLWNARWGAGRVVRFAPDGRIDREIALPVAQPTCCAFGGADRRTLYVTSARQELDALAPDSLDGGLFALRVDVAGLPSRRFAG